MIALYERDNPWKIDITNVELKAVGRLEPASDRRWRVIIRWVRYDASASPMIIDSGRPSR